MKDTFQEQLARAAKALSEGPTSSVQQRKMASLISLPMKTRDVAATDKNSTLDGLLPVTIHSGQTEYAEEGAGRWDVVCQLLDDPFFENLYAGLGAPRISSKRYSLVLAVLTYPRVASAGITQAQLDKAHVIAKFIQTSIRSGRLSYTHAKLPSRWPIGGNPGTKR